MSDRATAAKPTASAGQRDPRVIKRYANRKMYDTARSCYITLEEVAEIIRHGEEVRVIDNKTKDDLTEVTLTQALLSSERRKRGTVSLDSLRTLFAHGGELLQSRVTEPVARVANEAERTVEKWKHDAERTVGRFVKPRDDVARPNDADGAAAAVAPPVASDEAAAAPAEVASKQPPSIARQTQRAYDELQQRIDERVRLLVTALTHPPAPASEVVALRERIALLEERLSVLEGAKKTAE